MSYMLIGVGLLIIGMGLLLIVFLVRLYSSGEQGTSGGAEPNPPVTGYLLYALGVLFFGWSAYCLIRLEAAYGVWYLLNPLFAIFLCWAAIKVIKAGKDADKRHYENMAARAAAKDAHNRYAASQASLKYAHDNAARQHWLETERARTEAQNLETQRQLAETQRREAQLRYNLADIAEDNMLGVDDLTGINRLKFETNIKLSEHQRRGEIDLDLKQREAGGALDAADRVDHYQIIGQLEDELEQLYEKRRGIEKNEQDDVLREQKVARLNKRIQQLEADIDGRQNRLLSGRNGETPRRLA